MAKKNDLTREELATGVSLLLENNEPHIHLPQQKLFTLYSLAFQYLLYQSTKIPGIYLIRVEDSLLLEKLIRKSKDDTTRRFMEKLALPRRLTYKNSTFYLDFFHIGSWSLTSGLPKDRIKGALIVKNTISAPMMEIPEEDAEEANPQVELPKDFYYTSLKEFVPKTVVISFEGQFDQVETLTFPFINDEEKALSGVRLSKNLKFEE